VMAEWRGGGGWWISMGGDLDGRRSLIGGGRAACEPSLNHSRLGLT